MIKKFDEFISLNEGLDEFKEGAKTVIAVRYDFGGNWQETRDLLDN